MRISLVGDVMLGRLVAQAIERFGPDYPLGNTAEVLKKCDLTFFNLECVVSDKGKPVEPKTFHFKAPPQAIKTLKKAGVNAVTLANNHVLDFGKEAFLDMLGRLKKERIAFTGAGKNISEAKKPAIVKAGSVKVGVLAITDNEQRWTAGEEKPGIWFVPVDIGDSRFNQLTREIKKVKKGVDFLIVSAHVGWHFRQKPGKEFIGFARGIIDAGGDCYWGHSNHSFQGIEVYQGKPILYDTGDFIDDYAVDPAYRNDRSFIFFLNLVQGRVKDVKLLPTQIENFQVNLAKEKSADWSHKRMKKLCQDLGTKTRLVKGSLEVNL